MSTLDKMNRLELEILELRVLLDRVTGERDRARSTAVALEQELAMLTETREGGR